MKIAVTGANGFLGVGIVDSLLAAGVDVVAVGLTTERVNDAAERVDGDVFQMKNPFEELGRPDCVLHLAWRDGFVHGSDAHLEDLSKHACFIQKLIDGGLGRVAVMGSMHEIGFFEGCINEATPCNPQNMYGIAKNALRQAVFTMASEKTAVQWLRGFYIVDANVYGSSIFSKIAQAASEGKKSFPFTSGQNQFDFMEYSDFCDSVALVVSQDKHQGIINICSGKPEKLADRVERFISDNGYDITLKYGEYPDRPYDSKAVWGNNEVLESLKRNRK